MGGTTAQVASEELSHLEEGILFLAEAAKSPVTSPSPSFYIENIKKARTAQPQEP